MNLSFLIRARWAGATAHCYLTWRDSRRAAETAFLGMLAEAQEMRDLGELPRPVVVEALYHGQVVLRRTVRARVTRKAERSEGFHARARP